MKAYMRRATAYEQSDDLERALTDLKKVGKTFFIKLTMKSWLESNPRRATAYQQSDDLEHAFSDLKRVHIWCTGLSYSRICLWGCTSGLALWNARCPA